MDDPAAVLAQLAQQGAVRAAEHRLWKDTRKPRSGDVAWFSNASVARILDDCIGWQFLKMGIWDDDG